MGRNYWTTKNNYGCEAAAFFWATGINKEWTIANKRRPQIMSFFWTTGKNNKFLLEKWKQLRPRSGRLLKTFFGQLAKIKNGQLQTAAAKRPPSLKQKKAARFFELETILNNESLLDNWNK